MSIFKHKYINNTNLQQFRDDFIDKNYDTYSKVPFCSPTIVVPFRYHFLYNERQMERFMR